MQRLEVSGAVRPVYGSLGVKRLTRLATVILPQRKVPHKTRRSKTRYQDTRYTQCTVRSVQCAVRSVQCASFIDTDNQIVYSHCSSLL